MTVLENLWYGNIAPGVRRFTPGSEYDKLSSAANAAEEIIMAELSAEGRRAYAEYCKMVDRLSDISECDAFCKGFCLGVRLILEVERTDTQLPTITTNQL